MHAIGVLEEPVLAQRFAMIGSDGDQRILKVSLSLEQIEGFIDGRIRLQHAVVVVVGRAFVRFAMLHEIVRGRHVLRR